MKDQDRASTGYFDPSRFPLERAPVFDRPETECLGRPAGHRDLQERSDLRNGKTARETVGELCASRSSDRKGTSLFGGIRRRTVARRLYRHLGD